MNSATPEPSSREQKLQAVLHLYLRAMDAGEAVDQEALLREHAELADELRTHFETARRVEQAGQPLSEETLDLSGEKRSVPSAEQRRVRYFGDYELLEEIARGGMGVVFKARQVNLKRIVALKMILAGQLASQADVERFHAEAEAAARLDHPGIVPIYEVGEHEGQHYFSMAFVEGESLAHRVAREPMDPRAAAEVAHKVAQAISYAHVEGVIHRDLKPANVLLDKDGQPRVTDFGLAKRIDTDGALTATGQILGTPSYMPPEQASGRDGRVGPLSDVYSLGAILYCLLTARPPFQAATALDTLAQVMRQEPARPRQLNAAVPRDLETVCLKCLEKEPQRRYGSARDLAEDLHRFLQGEPVLARPGTALVRAVKWARRRPAVAGLLAVSGTAAVCLLVLAGFLWHNAEERGRAVQSLSQARAELVEVTNQRKNSEKIAAQQRALADQQRLLVDQSQKQVKQLSLTSADEKSKATAAQKEAQTAQQTLQSARREAARTLYAADMHMAHSAWQSGNVRDVTDLLERYRAKPGDDDLRGFEWNYLWRLCHGERLSLQPREPVSKAGQAVVAVDISDDGQLAAAAMIDGRVKVWDLATGKHLNSFQGPARGTVSVTIDGGRKMVTVVAVKDAAEKDIEKRVMQALRGNREQPSLAPFLQAHEVHSWKLAADQKPTVEQLDAARLAQAMRYGFWATDPFQFGVEGRLFTMVAAAVSPDGKTLAMGGISTALLAIGTMRGELLLWDLTTGKLAKRHEQPDSVSSLAFTPDGKKLAISGGFQGRARVLDLDSGSVVLTVTDAVGWFSFLRFDREGKRLATGSTAGHVGLWDAASGQQLAVFHGHQSVITRLAFSPDGGTILSASDDGAVKLWDTTTPLGPVVIDTGMGSNLSAPVFSSDGRMLTVAAQNGAVKAWDLDTRAEVLSIQGSKKKCEAFVLADGGQRVAWVEKDSITVQNLSDRRGTVVQSALAKGIWAGFSHDGMMLSAGSLNGTVKLWDSESGQLRTTLTRPGKASVFDLHAALSRDGQTLAFPQEKGVLVWNMATGKHVTFDAAHNVHKLAFSADGKLLAGTLDERLKIWQVDNGNEVLNAPLGRRNGFFDQLAFSPDSRRLAFGGARSVVDERGDVKLWDVSSGRVVLSIGTFAGQFRGLAFSPDGRRLGGTTVKLTALPIGDPLSLSAQVHIWEAASPDEQQPAGPDR